MTTQRATVWSVTINNPTPADTDAMYLARAKGWTVDGQIERGENGTSHYQMIVKTPQVRFSTVKKMFPRAHIEVARNVSALQSYVHKEDTRAGELPAGSAKYPSVSKMWDLILKHLIALGKDGLDQVALGDGDITMYRDEREYLFQTTPLVLLDETARRLISEGYYVEHHVCNPQVRQQWKLFAREILSRAWRASQETDRQTDSVQSVEVPVSVDDTTNHADDSTASQASDGLLEGEHGHSEEEGSTPRTEDEEGSTEDC